ncbi:hypothetical protein U1Q18_015670 [Sarracenia purpurea var. burkii]
MEAIGNEAGEQDKEEAKELEAREGSPKHNLVVKAKVESAVANSSAKGAILGTKEHEEVLAPIGLEPREQGESPKAIEQRRDSAEIAADDDKEDKEYAENEDLATVSFSHQKGKSPVLAQYMESYWAVDLALGYLEGAPTLLCFIWWSVYLETTAFRPKEAKFLA